MSESQRIEFVIEQRGMALAVEWALQSLRIYRTAALDKNHYGSSSAYKRAFIRSYLELKDFYFANKYEAPHVAYSTGLGSSCTPANKFI